MAIRQSHRAIPMQRLQRPSGIVDQMLTLAELRFLLLPMHGIRNSAVSPGQTSIWSIGVLIVCGRALVTGLAPFGFTCACGLNSKPE